MKSAGVAALLAALLPLGCGSDRIPLRVELGTRGVSKLPFVIAKDQGLYEKHGLDVELWMPPPEFEGGREARRDLWTRLRLRDRVPADIFVDGAGPMIVQMATNAAAPRQIVIASTDCVSRLHIIARRGIDRLEELEGKRIGVSAHMRTTTSYTALLLADRMGWDPEQDISIVRNGRGLDRLDRGVVDAFVANERHYAEAVEAGFPILADTRSWNEPIAGNSVRVDPDWLAIPSNRDAALRFLRAASEAIALLHADRELALDVLARWHGIRDPKAAAAVYDRAATMPRKPYPCYDGISRTLEIYDSHAMRAYDAEDFFDDSLVRELDESGFYDELSRLDGR